jgi:hypothetical protein
MQGISIKKAKTNHSVIFTTLSSGMNDLNSNRKTYHLLWVLDRSIVLTQLFKKDVELHKAEHYHRSPLLYLIEPENCYSYPQNLLPYYFFVYFMTDSIQIYRVRW